MRCGRIDSYHRPGTGILEGVQLSIGDIQRIGVRALGLRTTMPAHRERRIGRSRSLNRIMNGCKFRRRAYMELIRLENVTKEYLLGRQTVQALKQVDQGRVLTFIAPAGAS